MMQATIPRNRVLSHPTRYGFLESQFLCFQICANPFYLWPGVFELALFKLGQLNVESYNINNQYNCVMSPQQGGVVRNVTLPYPTLPYPPSALRQCRRRSRCYCILNLPCFPLGLNLISKSPNGKRNAMGCLAKMIY